MSDIKTSDEELQDLIYDALTYVQDKDYFARKGTIIPSYAQVEATIELIKSHTNSEITAVLDRLENAAMERPITNSEIRGAIEAERERL